MANRYFNKQVTESRKPLAKGGSLSKPVTKELEALNDGLRNFRKPDPKGTGRSGRPGINLLRPIPKGLKEAIEKDRKLSESIKEIRKKKKADYMKKHGEKAPRRKTLSVKNSYKKEVGGLK